MGLWKEFKEQFPKEADHAERRLSPAEPPHRVKAGSQKADSIIAPDLSIEGKIEGAGHVRIAGRFKGDVRVNGDLTVESGAHVAGEIRAETILVGGEVHGNIQADSRVQLLESGTLIGDLKAGSLTVAAGSRMRGKAEFGWDEPETTQASVSEESGAR